MTAAQHNDKILFSLRDKIRSHKQQVAPKFKTPTSTAGGGVEVGVGVGVTPSSAQAAKRGERFAKL